MGRLVCQGETLVDLYTGIGYFTVPLLACSGVAKVGRFGWGSAWVLKIYSVLRA